jgi:S1-C subfamily serine protease
VPDDDLEPRTASVPAAEASAPEDTRSVAPPGKGLRTGTIARAHLVAVLDAGPGTFLRQLEVAPRLSGDRFVGWQLVQLLDRQGPLHDVDLAPGDVLLAINGKPLSRPEQLQVVWDSLRTANEVTARMWRGDQKLDLHFTIEPPVH